MTEQVVEQELRIDDLSFSDLLRLALEEVPSASGGRWTLHGPVDPGVTLLERFAWELEQRLFSAEQVTDQMVRASLRLLGLGDPAATAWARTVLCLDGADGPVTLPAGVVFRLERDPWGRRLALARPVTVLPIESVDVGGRLHVTGDRLELAPRYRGPRIDSAVVSLLVDLDAAPGVPPAWSADAVDVPPPGELRWTAVGPDGSEAAAVVADSTGGLRRSGLLRLDWPAVWNRLGAEGCRLCATLVTGSYPEPVRVRGVHPNAVEAADRVAETLDVSTGLAGFLPLPSRSLTLAGTAGRLLGGPGQVTLDLTEPDGTTGHWTSVADWTGIGPGERVFVVDRERGQLRFGDGRAGRIPRPLGGTTAVARFATGGGSAGNLGSGGSWVAEDGAQKATNPVASTGGSEAETVASAELRAADERGLADRTVTVDDVEKLALDTPGVGLQRAHASPGLHPDFPCVPMSSALSVTVVPYADRSADPDRWTPAPLPDAGALAAVRAQMATGRLVGQEVFVLAPVLRSVSVSLVVTRSALSSALEARLRSALRRHLDPLVGGADGAGWPFGGPVRPSALIGVVGEELGPESTVTDLAVALDETAPSSCDDLQIGERELVYLGDLQVTWVASAPTGGGLR